MKAKQSKTTKTTKASVRRPLMIITRQAHGAAFAGDPLDAAKQEAERLGYDVLVLPYGATAFLARG